MCWIIGDESVKTDKTVEDKSIETNVNDGSLEVVDLTSTDKVISGKVKSQKEEEEEKLQESVNRSAHTLIDINFKIKKGKNLTNLTNSIVYLTFLLLPPHNFHYFIFDFSYIRSASSCGWCCRLR